MCARRIDDGDRSVRARDQVRRLDILVDHHRRKALQVDQDAEHLVSDVDDLRFGELVWSASRASSDLPVTNACAR